jgi:NADPH-dependent 2,4-dienoyl-CoA reductase/sulfur reductase-like enzyme
VQAAQLVHAAGYSTKIPIPDGTYAIALHVPDEPALRGLAARLKDAGIDHVLVIEEDKPYAGQAMAIGIAPAERRLLKPFLSPYALVAQPGRAAGVMTQQVAGSNPAERSTHAARSEIKGLG